MWDTLFGSEAARGVMAGALMALLSIPKAALGELLRRAPDQIIPPQHIPLLLAGVGLVSGAYLGHYTPIPMDLAMAVGMGAGLGSGAAHDNPTIHRALEQSGIRGAKR